MSTTNGYAFARRAFLASVGGAIGLHALLRGAEARAQGMPTGKRLMVLHRPNGTIRSQWLPRGGGAGAVRGPILEPFAPVWSRAVALDGLRVVTANGGLNSHEGGLTTLMTGAPIGTSRIAGGDDWRNTGPSLDQVLLAQSPALRGTAIGSLQVGAHNRQDGGPEVANRAMSYAGPDAPLYPVVRPSAVYARLFGTMMPGGATAANLERLRRARARQQSVLDFVRGDLGRLAAVAPASERPRFEAHGAAIRELEMTLDRMVPATGAVACTPGAAPTDPRDTDFYTDVAAVGRAQFALLRAAFQCDLARVVTFMWGTGASGVQFEGLFPGMARVGHHPLSHENIGAADIAQRLGAIDRWYSERTAEFITQLASTPDPFGGVLLDNTLVMYVSEVAAGNHTFDNMPIVFFGGPGVGLAGNRIMNFGGRSTNDMWLAVARAFGVSMSRLGADNQFTGPIAGLFA